MHFLKNRSAFAFPQNLPNASACFHFLFSYSYPTTFNRAIICSSSIYMTIFALIINGFNYKCHWLLTTEHTVMWGTYEFCQQFNHGLILTIMLLYLCVKPQWCQSQFTGLKKPLSADTDSATKLEVLVLLTMQKY